MGSMTTINTPEFRELMAWFATACHDPYAALEPRAVAQTGKELLDYIDAWHAAQVKAAVDECEGGGRYCGFLRRLRRREEQE